MRVGNIPYLTVKPGIVTGSGWQGTVIRGVLTPSDGDIEATAYERQDEHDDA